MIKCGSCQARTALAEFRCAMCDTLIVECAVAGEHGGGGSDQRPADKRAEVSPRVAASQGLDLAMGTWLLPPAAEAGSRREGDC
jgi:hypothetical protein